LIEERMNQQEFEHIFEKLTDRRREVLHQLMLGQTDTAIASFMGIRERTVRKHIERICQEFGLGDDHHEGRRYKRSDLVAIFAKYKPELLSDRIFSSTKELVGVETAKTKHVVIPGVVSQPQQVAEEINSISLFQMQLYGRETVTELLDKFQIFSDEPGKIQIAKTLNRIGYDEYLKGNFEQASFYLEWAIKINPEMGAAHYNLALTFERLCDLSRGRNHYEIARKQSNVIAADAATNNLARLEIRQRNFEQAVQLLKPILLRAEDTEVKASLYKNFGWAHYQLKDYEQAKESLLKSLELKSDYAPAYYLLAKIQEITDDQEGALSSFEKFLSYDSNQPKSTKGEWRVPELDDWHFEAVKYLEAYNTKA